MWKKKLNHITNSIMGSVVGVFLGYGAYSIWDYTARPGLYAIRSAPWYTGVLMFGVFAGVVLLLGILLKWMIRKSSEE